MTPSLEHILDAHGGLVRWRSRTASELEMSAYADGLWLPTRRRVYPRGPLGRPLPLPALVAIDVHDARLRSD